jgi:hypothetical protein
MITAIAVYTSPTGVAGDRPSIDNHCATFNRTEENIEMPKPNLSKSLAAAALLIVSGTSMAASGVIATATVTKVLVDGGAPETNYGGCMAALSVSPSSILPTCAAGWVTFSCTGSFAANTIQAYRLLDQAQLALATGKQVSVYFRDDQKHNGYCFARRIDVK